jgi:hypothetical protein
MEMNEFNPVTRCRQWCRNGLVVVLGAVVLVSTAAAGENAVAATPSDTAKSTTRVSPHALAALRRAQQPGDASTPRTGLQSQMQKDAARRHLAPARRGT